MASLPKQKLNSQYTNTWKKKALTFEKPRITIRFHNKTIHPWPVNREKPCPIAKIAQAHHMKSHEFFF
jgi:hypothetical protein